MENDEQIEVLEGEIISESSAIQKKEESGGRLVRVVDSFVLLAGLVSRVISVFKKNHGKERDNRRNGPRSFLKQRKRRRKGRE